MKTTRKDAGAGIASNPGRKPGRDIVVRLEDAAARRSAKASEHEVGELVLGAWMMALEARREGCVQGVEPVARRRRAALAERIETLPYVQLLDPLVQQEYWRQVNMISEQETLAQSILEGAATYAAKTPRG
ncbi:hypothetical protein [Roseicyclus sp.]|uniref:hypothetical protein n=1 Tax=Roseicyclus sp. TaxID=1914329 RepID=UPI003F9ED0C4